MSIDPAISLAFAAGMVASINPCGFAMLPAYLSFFLGTDDPSTSTAGSVVRALEVGLAVSAGFVVVFGLIGIPLSGLNASIQAYLPWVTIAIGIVLAVLGVAMLRGWTPAVALPKLTKGGQSRELWSMFLFGVSYAVSSLSCTIPVFLVLVANSFTASDFGTGMATFLAYGLGMALILVALTLAIALARQGFVNRLRSSVRYINRVAGGLLVVAALYLVYYGWYELQIQNGNLDPWGGAVAEAVFDLNSDLSNWVNRTGPGRIGLVLAGIIGLAVATTLLIRRRRGGQAVDTGSRVPGQPGDEPATTSHSTR